MKTEVKKLERGQVEITIEMTVDEYQPFLEQAAKAISENIKVPGFRPGKAGYDIVKQKVGEAEIWQEALELAVHKTFLKAIDENNLITVGNPKVDIVKLAPGNPVIYKATVGLLPKAEIGDYAKIKINKTPITASDDQIKAALANLQKMYAKETLVDKKAATGDKVEINFETFLDKIPVDKGQSEKFPLVIGEKTFIPGFEEELIGLGKDETKQFQLKFPQNYHQKNLAGKLVDFKVKMNAVYQLDLPELNDEFTKRLGEFKDLAELKDRIAQNIRDEAEVKENQKLEEEMIDKIIEVSTFDDVPDILINSETNKMVEELEHNLAGNGLKFDDYLVHLKKTREELLLDFVPQAIKRVKSAIIIRRIAEIQKITVTDKELDNEVEKTISMYGHDPEVLKNIKQPAYRSYLRNILTARKVIDYFKSVIIVSKA